MSDLMIKIENLKKQYKLGTIGGQTLNAELQSWWARKRGKEDPNLKIGQDYSNAGEKFWALNGINLEVKKGEALGIIGHNGAGKSTLLKILSRVTAPTEGDIWLNGRVASMLEVGTGFHGELTGRENIYMNGAILGMTKKEVDNKLESIIDFSECRQFIDTPVKRYSSGMYVKLAFAVASHLDAEIMVMDEVLAVGDMKFQKKCLGRMGDVSANEGKTILYVSHNMATIRNLCTRCIVLDKGKLIFDGDVDKAIEIYMNSNNEELLSCYDLHNIPRKSYTFGKKVHIDSFEFINKDVPRFFDNELIVFRVKWRSIERTKNIRARLEVFYADSSIVGMSESSKILDSEEGGLYESILSFNPSNLSYGMYYFRFSFFTLENTRNHTGLDDVPVKVWFEVLESENDRSNWLKQYWGNVRFDDIEIEKRG